MPSPSISTARPWEQSGGQREPWQSPRESPRSTTLDRQRGEGVVLLLRNQGRLEPPNQGDIPHREGRGDNHGDCPHRQPTAGNVARQIRLRIPGDAYPAICRELPLRYAGMVIRSAYEPRHGTPRQRCELHRSPIRSPLRRPGKLFRGYERRRRQRPRQRIPPVLQIPLRRTSCTPVPISLRTLPFRKVSRDDGVQGGVELPPRTGAGLRRHRAHDLRLLPRLQRQRLLRLEVQEDAGTLSPDEGALL